jgi:glycosyltransferase involved in cell wall biosynthesis
MFDCLLKKFDVLYVSMRGVKPPSPEARRGLQIMELPLRVNPASGASKLLNTLLFYGYLPILRRRLRRLKPALIVSQETLPFVPIAMARLGVPTVIGGFGDLWWRIVFGGNPLTARFADFMDRYEIRQWRKLGIVVITSTRAETDVLVQRGMDRERIVILNVPGHVGIYFPCEAGAERAAMGFAPTDWVVAIHGTIRPGKGYGQLLEWWQALVKAHPNWRLLIIGGAGGEDWCRNLVRRLDLEAKVHLTGWLPTQNDVNRHLNAADCLLVVRRNSSDNQGIPSALFHSLAVGKPTVATGLAGISEIVRHQVDGFLFEPDNYESFRATLEYVAEHPAEAAAVGQAGRAREKECFNPDQRAAQVAEVIEELISP